MINDINFIDFKKLQFKFKRLESAMNSIVNIQNSAIDQQHADEIFKQAKTIAQTQDLAFTGFISPQNAWALFQSAHAVIVDVRTHEERTFVGYIPESIHIAWATGTSLNRNPRFVKELENKVGKDKPILLLCRSGKRSAAAATAAFQAGFKNIYNIEQGFEGDLDDHQHRGSFNGWRFHQLPWQQD